jgi:hypothetical protein
MTVEITSVEIGEEKITIEALAIEDILMADDLYEDVEVPTVKYEFDRKAKNGAEMKYLWKVVQGQKKCQSAKSMGAKLEKLVGVMTQLSDSFKAQAE